MLPCRWRGVAHAGRANGVITGFFVCHQPREKHASGEDKGVGHPAAARAPPVLVFLSGQAQRANGGIGDRAAQLVLVLAAVDTKTPRACRAMRQVGAVGGVTRCGAAHLGAAPDARFVRG